MPAPTAARTPRASATARSASTPSSPSASIDRPPGQPATQTTPLLAAAATAAESSRDASLDGLPSTAAGSFFDQVADGIRDRDRERVRGAVVRYAGFLWAVVNCLCAGSITAFSLYGPLFLSHLKYTQLQVNLVSITAELAMYLPVPVFGYLCDRIGPGWCSLLSGCFFGFGYLLAAFTYQSGPPPSASSWARQQEQQQQQQHGDGWPFWAMVVAFVGVGMGTSCMYLSAVTTCAKNFGRGRYKGVALAVPIAAFGLSGMWLSQVGDHFFSDSRGRVRGDVDVYRFFLFLGLLFLAVGVVGTFALRVVDEAVLIDAAIDQLEQSGLLDDEAEFFRRASSRHGYGTVAAADLSDSTVDFLRAEAEDMKAKADADRARKNWLLNAETRRFLRDRTMWLLAAGFFLVTGPGEAFINNLGTIIGTLYPPGAVPEDRRTAPSTHVSIVALTSTLARLVTGTLSDVLAPAPEPPVAASRRREPDSPLASSSSSLEPPPKRSGFRLSRMAFLLAFSGLCSLGQVLLASGAIQDHGRRFAAVSALVGSGYGAVFSLVPIVISVVWGVENFGTNWGVVAMAPAAGAAVWGLVYSAVYEAAADARGLCYGVRCYAPSFWAMAVSVWVACALWVWAWRGPGGWRERGVAV